jgi:hypothetical protein
MKKKSRVNHISKLKTDIFSMKKRVICVCVGLCFVLSAFTADLTVSVNDIRLVKAEDGGYHLYIKQKEGVNSVLLTETTKSDDGKSDNYAYRAKDWNPVNGDEKRMLNGSFLESPSSRYSLIDSTPQTHAELGNAFHIYIPKELDYGYPWSRNGTVTIQKGTFISIRTFTKSYADYDGADFLDNPFLFNFIPVPKKEDPPQEKPSEKEEVLILYDDYNPKAASSFEGIANMNKGAFKYSRGPETIIEDIINSVLEINPKNKVDVVFAIDTTGSMKDEIKKLREELVPRLTKELEKFGEIRLGLLLYRDYVDNYRYKNLPVKYFPFSNSPDEFFSQLNGFSIDGNPGGDIPEAVYEALYASINFYDWDLSAQRKIILIGDAEPHPSPRGYLIKCTKEMIEALALQKDITIDTIITPEDKK